jgi:tetratricopeptide (TPR) repeat protein
MLIIKKLKMRILFTLGIVTLCNFSFAQKVAETDAAISFNAFNQAFYSGDLAKAQKNIADAKSSIDQAALNDETKNSPKTLFYKGEIYLGYLLAYAQDTVLLKDISEKYIEEAVGAYKSCYAVSKSIGGKVFKNYKADLKETISNKKNLFSMAANMSYEQKKYADAAEVYELGAKLSSTIEEIDTVSIFNAGLCFEKSGDFLNAARLYNECATYNYNAPDIYSMVSYCYRATGNITEAENIVNTGRKKYPLDQGLIKEMVNNKIASGDNAGAEAALNEAIAGDPDNKDLYYVIGTIFSESNKFDKAEEALNKSLEIDPNYEKSLYQLGAILISWAGNIQDSANTIGYKHPDYKKLLADANEIYKRALVPLDKYVSIKTDDVEVLTLLWQISRNLEDTVKAEEYKKRMDALKQ